MPRAETVLPLRERQKNAARELILDALVEALSAGALDRATNDALAKTVGVSRMTVYRHFPDRDALMQAVWDRVTKLAGPSVGFPRTEEELLSSLPAIYKGFDNIAPLATLIRSTPQGRAVRLSQRKRRRESYTAAAADVVRDLPESDQRLATAVLQLLHTTAWLEMRDQWELPGEEIAKACGWAMRTLIADLRTRGGKPLDAA